jgi:DEAD/DEAH box helicase domain-containing protein
VESFPRGEVLVFDLETQRAFDEVEDRRADRLGLSVGVLYSYATGRFHRYREADARALVDRLLAARLVIGFNHRRFDLPVLAPYAPPGSLDAVPTLDLMQDLEIQLGHRVGLEACARASLGQLKAGSGLIAITWYREGRLDDLERYCEADVRLTRDLFEHGRRHGHVSAELRDEAVPRVVRIPVTWALAGVPEPALAVAVQRS